MTQSYRAEWARTLIRIKKGVKVGELGEIVAAFRNPRQRPASMIVRSLDFPAVRRYNRPLGFERSQCVFVSLIEINGPRVEMPQTI